MPGGGMTEARTLVLFPQTRPRSLYLSFGLGLRHGGRLDDGRSSDSAPAGLFAEDRQALDPPQATLCVTNVLPGLDPDADRIGHDPDVGQDVTRDEHRG